MINKMNIKNFQEILEYYENSSEILYNIKRIINLNASNIDLLKAEHSNLVHQLKSFKSRIALLTIQKTHLNNKILNPSVLSTEKNTMKDQLNNLRIEINLFQTHKDFLKSNKFKKISELIYIEHILMLDSYLNNKLIDLNEKFKLLKENYDEIKPNKTQLDTDDNLNELCYKSYELYTLEKKITSTLLNIFASSKKIDDLLELNNIQTINSLYNNGVEICDIQKIFTSYNIKEIINLELDISDEYLLNLDFKYE